MLAARRRTFGHGWFFRLALVTFVAQAAVGQTFVRTVLDTEASSRAVRPDDIATIETELQTNRNVVPQLSPDAKSAVEDVLAQRRRTADLSPAIRQEVAQAITRSRMTSLADLPAEVREQALFLANCAARRSELVNVAAPVRWDPELAQCFWSQQGLEFLKSGQIGGNSKQATAALELLSDFFAGLRLDVKTSVSAAADASDETEEAKRRLQQLITSGGNFSLTARYPWYAYESSGQRAKALVTSYSRLGAVIPAFGESDSTGASPSLDLKEANGSFEVGLFDAQGEIASFGRKITFVAFTKIVGIQGTKKFHESITSTKRRPFAYAQYGIGMKLSEYFYLTASFSRYSDDKLPRPGGVLLIGVGR